jgi:two-component sensor histidine kinase
LDSDEVNKFSDEDIKRLEPLANAASIALENARLYEQALRDADTKAALLKEINHRVKNNLSAIIGLLYAERRHARLKNLPAYQTIAQELITRIQGLATVHTLLSASEWQPLSLSYLVNQLIRTALQTVSRDKQIIIDVLPSPVQVTPQQANSLALIITELATLYIKYALPEQESTKLDASITAFDTQIQLKFQGISPKCFSAMMQAERDSVGLYLIRNIVKSELHGTIEVDRNTGSTIIVSFRNELGESIDDTGA